MIEQIPEQFRLRRVSGANVSTDRRMATQDFVLHEQLAYNVRNRPAGRSAQAYPGLPTGGMSLIELPSQVGFAHSGGSLQIDPTVGEALKPLNQYCPGNVKRWTGGRNVGPVRDELDLFGSIRDGGGRDSID
jgi:hypothetical protein